MPKKKDNHVIEPNRLVLEPFKKLKFNKPLPNNKEK